MPEQSALTENEAKERWCPKTQIAYDGRNILSNRPPEFERQGYCLGSLCLWWRWERLGRTGYCGAAGDVE